MSYGNLLFYLATENEPLDTWDEEETILTPDGDNDNDDEVSYYFLVIQYNIMKILMIRRWKWTI